MMMRCRNRFGGDGAPLVVARDAPTPYALEKALNRLRRLSPPRPVPVAVGDWDRERGTRGTRPLPGADARRPCWAPRLTAVHFSARFQVVATRRDGCEDHR